MTRIIDVNLERLTHDAFAPYGQIIGAQLEPTDWKRPRLDVWKMPFSIDGTTELRVMRYHYQQLEFQMLERHMSVTESRIPMGGVRAIMVVAGATPLDEPNSFPPPDSVRAFYLDGTQGLMLWRGTWHALDCFPITQPYADFGFISEVETEDEIELSVEPAIGERTQITNYDSSSNVSFRIVDPLGLADAA